MIGEKPETKPTTDERIAAAKLREKDATASLALAGFRGGAEADMLSVLARLRVLKSLVLARGWCGAEAADALAEWDALEAEARALIVEELGRQMRASGALVVGRKS